MGARREGAPQETSTTGSCSRGRRGRWGPSPRGLQAPAPLPKGPSVTCEQRRVLETWGKRDEKMKHSLAVAQVYYAGKRASWAPYLETAGPHHATLGGGKKVSSPWSPCAPSYPITPRSAGSSGLSSPSIFSSTRTNSSCTSSSAATGEPMPPLPPLGAPSASVCSRAWLGRPLGEAEILTATFSQLDLSWGWVPNHTPLIWPKQSLSCLQPWDPCCPPCCPFSTHSSF